MQDKQGNIICAACNEDEIAAEQNSKLMIVDTNNAKGFYIYDVEVEINSIMYTS